MHAKSDPSSTHVVLNRPCTEVHHGAHDIDFPAAILRILRVWSAHLLDVYAHVQATWTTCAASSVLEL